MISKVVSKFSIFLVYVAAYPAHGSERHFDEVSCLVEPGRQATLSTRLPGVIDEIRVRTGDVIKEGDTLFVQGHDVEQASLALENARAQYAQRRLARNQRLIERGMLSESERDELDTELRLAQMQAGLARAQMIQRSTQAPFNGVVTRVVAEEGEYVDGTPVLELAQLDPLRINVVLSLESFGSFEVGEILGVYLNAPVNNELSAKVDNIDSIIDASSGTFGIDLIIDNPDFIYPAGIACTLLIPDQD